AFGREEAQAFALSNNERPPTAFRLVPAGDAERDVLEELRAAGAELEASRVALDAWRVKGAGAVVRNLAAEGLIYIQDEASQLVAHALGAQPGELILDACAAPGSKTTHIAARTSSRAHVVAGDLYEHRLRLVREAVGRQRAATVSLVAYDAEAALPFKSALFDRVLVDAPCTGTGTLRRNPEIRWRISPSDIPDLASRQASILRNAARAVRPGGRLVYSTCSVEPEENEEVVEAFLNERGDFVESALDVPGRMKVGAGRARTWPHRDGSDGFFVAAFERRN
ncbi:MAG TPA: RsmB/NOP family class I SAM-dependent RNA methyltransferase, partial [Pyrinomonadaceae bacterium]